MVTRDPHTIDMFLDMPPAPVTTPGGLSCRSEIAHAMSEALRGHDRYDIAAKMSRLLDRDISKHMLDAYTAESREDHIPPLDTAIAFDLAIGSSVLADLFARKIGARLATGRDTMDAKLGQLERLRDEAAKQIKAIKKAIGQQHE